MKMMKNIALGLALISVALPVHAGKATPKNLPVSKAQAITTTSTILLIAGLIAKGVEFTKDGKALHSQLNQRETTLLVSLLAGGKIAEEFGYSGNIVALKAVLASTLMKLMLSMDSNMNGMPVASYFRAQDPTKHMLRILSFLVFFDLSKRGIDWAAHRLGIIK